MSDLETFRSDTRAWLETCPTSMRGAGASAIGEDGDCPSGADGAPNGPIPKPSSGSTAWRTRAGPRRPGRRNMAAAGFPRQKRACWRRNWRASRRGRP